MGMALGSTLRSTGQDPLFFFFRKLLLKPGSGGCEAHRFPGRTDGGNYGRPPDPAPRSPAGVESQNVRGLRGGEVDRTMSEMDERPTDRPLRPTHLVRVLVVVLVGLLLVLAWRAERPEAPDLPAALPAALPAGEEDEPRGGGSEKTSSSGHWKALVPRSGAERVAERLGMVAGQIENRRRGSWSLAVLEAMRTVPRHVFVPASHRAKAYRDSPLPIGFGQTISQPYIVALMTELLDVAPGDRILEIGTGSGWPS